MSALSTAHFDARATTACTCWIVRRADGVALGFTDHDRLLTIEGVTCTASSGFGATEAAAHEGFASGTQDIEGVLDDAALRDEDIDASLYDDARIEEWLVDWNAPDQRFHLRTSLLGAMRRNGASFTAELRSVLSLLDRAIGRTFGRRCDAILGDERCGVDLADAAHRADVQIVRIIDASTYVVATTDGSTIDLADFAGGSLAWTSGDNAGRSAPMSSRRLALAEGIRLLEPPPAPVMEGTTARLAAGCDHSFATCRDRFDNQMNFRGFPHMPGEEFAVSYVDGADIHDGAPIIR